MINWIERELAEAIHNQQLAEHGGGSGVRDENLLLSALSRPQQLYACGNPPPDLCDLAASLAYGLAKNHPFVDGNKRTAWVCCRVFVALNDGQLQASQEDKYHAILSLAEGAMTEGEFAAWLRKHTSLHQNQVNETSADYQVK